MTWQPIQPAEFWQELRSSVEAMTNDAKTLFDRYSVPPYPASCRRGEAADLETVYVVARGGPWLVFFDDVEDEYAVAKPGTDGVLEKWELCGELEFAIGVLNKKPEVGL